MQKVVGINLNGNAYQVEEPGYEALRAYLQGAESRLESNPDRAEIMADLEQAIAEKCGRYLGPSKTVVTAAEMATIIAEIGPVDSPEATAEAGPSGEADATDTAGKQGGPRRLYQIRQGAMISGVCNGIAAFFAIDVTIVRLVFVLLACVTFGAGVVAYIVMAVVIPYADTAEDRAAAYGLRLKAQELLDQANLHRASARARREWRRAWKWQQRAWQRSWGEHWQSHWDQKRRHWDRGWERMAQTQAAMATGAAPMGPFGHVLAGITLPVFAVVNAALFVAWILVIMSALMTGAIFGWPLPADLPLWGTLLILCAVYLVLTSPLRAARHGAHLAWGPYYPMWSALSSVFWLGFTALFLWLAYQHLPQVHALLDQLPSFWRSRRISFVV
ncbi:MAG TPA: PspC domain-containing protein [Steroidobacteraceae bacterium]|jgi:phage shock protein PspC (stress-responsive transcriptional regulator)|nr:PspC domain-containing protein [Steroidobacteraceae bacterium]